MPGGVRERDIKIKAKLARKAGGKKQARAIIIIRKKNTLLVQEHI